LCCFLGFQNGSHKSRPQRRYRFVDYSANQTCDLPSVQSFSHVMSVMPSSEHQRYTFEKDISGDENSYEAHKSSFHDSQSCQNQQLSSSCRERTIGHQMNSYEKMSPVNEHLTAMFSRPKKNMPIRDKVVELLQDYPTGIFLNKFSRAFEKRFGGSIDEHWMSFGSVFELLMSMTDLVELQDQTNGDILIKIKMKEATRLSGMPVCNLDSLS